MLTFMVSSCQDLFAFVISSFRWCFQTFFYVHPYLGKIPILTNIFQMGWNHHLVIFWVSDFPIDRHGCTWMCVKGQTFLDFNLYFENTWFMENMTRQFATSIRNTPSQHPSNSTTWFGQHPLSTSCGGPWCITICVWKAANMPRGAKWCE